MTRGRVFVAFGLLLVALATAALLIALPNALYLLFGKVKLVDYALYMVEAQLVVHSIVFVLLFVPGAFLIQRGRRLLRNARNVQLPKTNVARPGQA